jgi:anaerobic selenocysteine-containing dehydrogenase
VSVRGIGWYAGAFVALIVAAAFLAVAAASFLASLTPLYVSIVCSFAAVGCGVVAAVRARPAAVPQPDDAGRPGGEGDRVRPIERVEAAERAEAAEPSEAEEPAEAAQPGDPQ